MTIERAGHVKLWVIINFWPLGVTAGRGPFRKEKGFHLVRKAKTVTPQSSKNHQTFTWPWTRPLLLLMH